VKSSTSSPDQNVRQSHSLRSFYIIAFQARLRPTRVAVMESQVPLAVGLSAREATISDRTEARRASSANRYSWNSVLLNSTTSQSCHACNFTFIS
jgi:hypothetical protein